MAARTRIRIAVTDPDGAAAAPRVVTLPAHLGRDPQRVEVEIPDRMVSRRHARLEPDGDDVVLVDLESGNGTWIGDERITRRTLATGEEITVGTSTVVWTVIPDPLRPATRPAVPTVRPSVPTSGRTAGKPPSFGTAWGVVLLDGTLRAVPLKALYAAWCTAARTVATLPDLLAPEDADPGVRLDAHDRLSVATDALMEGPLARLGSLTFAFSAPTRRVDAFASRVPRVRRLADHTRARDGVAALRERLHLADAEPTTRLVAAEDRRMVARFLTALRDGITAFQTHGGAVLDEAGAELEGALNGLFAALTERDQHIAAHLRVAEGTTA